MVYDTAKQLAAELKSSGEYREFQKEKETVMEDAATKALVDEYHKLQIRAQAAMVSGEKNDELMAKLQKVGEVLQFNPGAASYLMAEFRMNRMLGDVYKILADAVDVDLSALENA